MSRNAVAEASTEPADREEVLRECERLETEAFDPRHRARAERLEQAAAALGLVDLGLRAQLIEADILLRSGETAAGGRAGCP